MLGVARAQAISPVRCRGRAAPRPQAGRIAADGSAKSLGRTGSYAWSCVGWFACARLLRVSGASAARQVLDGAADAVEG